MTERSIKDQARRVRTSWAEQIWETGHEQRMRAIREGSTTENLSDVAPIAPVVQQKAPVAQPVTAVRGSHR